MESIANSITAVFLARRLDSWTLTFEGCAGASQRPFAEEGERAAKIECPAALPIYMPEMIHDIESKLAKDSILSFVFGSMPCVACECALERLRLLFSLALQAITPSRPMESSLTASFHMD